jgi:hypothetical protein
MPHVLPGSIETNTRIGFFHQRPQQKHRRSRSLRLRQKRLQSSPTPSSPHQNLEQ